MKAKGNALRGLLAGFVAAALALAAPATARATEAGEGGAPSAPQILVAQSQEEALALEAQAITSMYRIGGSDRYSTMGSIVSEGFGSSDWAVVASGQDFPDALAASPLAGIKRCPVVLTTPDGLSAEASYQLKSLGVRNVYLMGGTSSASDGVERAIRALGASVTRVEGADRVATSLATLEAVRAEGSVSTTVVLASGTSFADTLSIGPWAYRTGSPVVLVGANGMLSDAAVAAIRSDPYAKNVLIVGGPSAVSNKVQDQLGTGYAYGRLAGADRYATCAAVVEWETQHGLGWSNPAIATGRSFPDALAGAALEGTKGSVLLLVSKASDPTVGLLADNYQYANRLYVLGGERSVPSDLADPGLYKGLWEARHGKSGTGVAAGTSAGTGSATGAGTAGGSGTTSGSDESSLAAWIDSQLVIDNENPTFVVNMNPERLRYHKPGCQDVPNIASRNRRNVRMSSDELKALGLVPCGHCHP